MLRVGDRNLIILPESRWEEARKRARIGNGNVVLTVPDGASVQQIEALALRIVDALRAAGWTPEAGPPPTA